MIKNILTYNNEEDKKILNQKSQEVINIEEIQSLIQDLKDTLHSIKNAKGLSAIQIGENKKVCICSWGGKEILMINPVITRERGKQKYLEGCLSVPGIYKEIERAQKVWCTYLDENGKKQEIADGGRMSNIIQHELDHFNGECKIYEKGDEDNGKEKN